MILLSVVCFAVGVALLMQGLNFLALHRSSVPRHLRGAAGAKSIVCAIAGGALAVGGIVLLLLQVKPSS